METTLAQIAMPSVSDPISFILLLGSAALLVWLLYKFVKSRYNTAPYIGHTAIVVLLFAAFVYGIGSWIPVGESETGVVLPAAVVMVVGYVFKVVGAIVWPVLTMVAISIGKKYLIDVPLYGEKG